MADLGAIGQEIRGIYAMPIGFTLPHLRPGGFPLRAVVMPELEREQMFDPLAYRALAGRVSHEGIPSVSVSVWGWESRQLRARTETAADGSWALAVGPGQYGITYHVTGYQPISHGPYQF